MNSTNGGADNRMVVDVPGAPVQQDTELDQSPERVDTGLMGSMPRRDSLMEDTMNLKDQEY